MNRRLLATAGAAAAVLGAAGRPWAYLAQHRYRTYTDSAGRTRTDVFDPILTVANLRIAQQSYANMAALSVYV